MQAWKKHVVAQDDGRIVITVPELQPGMQADVIILGASAEGPAPEALEDLVGSCKGMFASIQEADEYLDRERNAWE